jgi:hypothetical protein
MSLDDGAGVIVADMDQIAHAGREFQITND